MRQRHITETVYDANGRLDYREDAEDRVTDLEYDALDRVVSVTRYTEPQGAGSALATTYDYDGRIGISLLLFR